MNQGTVRKRDLDHRDIEVFRHANIMTSITISNRTAETDTGISDGRPMIEAAMAEHIMIHQAHEQLLKKILAPLRIRDAV